jgi:hypothetical protein
MSTKYVCGDLPTPLVNGQTSWVYPSIPVQSLYISCYVTVNKLVLSYLLLRLLPQLHIPKPRTDDSLYVFLKMSTAGSHASMKVFTLDIELCISQTKDG